VCDAHAGLCRSGRRATFIVERSSQVEGVTESVALLTERERQCLRLVHAHFNSKQIARELGIRPGTVDRHCENATRKLQVENRIAAALALAAREGVGGGSQSGSFPIPAEGLIASTGGAERTPYVFEQRSHPHPALGRGRSPLHEDGDDLRQAPDAASPHGGGAQAGAVPDAERRDEGAGLYRSGYVGRELRADPVGLGRLGSILIVFGVAAAAAWILTAAAGAEQFAFVLQKLRYGS